MKREVSVYIDLLRFMAAFAGLLEHLSDHLGGWVWRFGGVGGEAVGVFFVLSGFVISYVTQSREHDAATYTLARAARLYSVIVPAMFLTYLLDRSLYESALYVDGTIWDYVRSLTFTNQLWNTVTHVGTMGPYWSLGFEVPYYLAFGAWMFLPTGYAGKILAMFALVMFFGPRIATYFPLWLLGVACQQAMVKAARTSQTDPRPMLWTGVTIATLVLLVVWRLVNYHAEQRLRIGIPREFAAGELRPIIYFYGLGVLLAIHLLAFSRLPHKATRLLMRLEKPIRWLAGATFSLYLLNLPAIICFKAVLSGMPAGNAKTSLVMILTLCLSLAVAAIFERRKYLWREALGRLFLRGNRVA
jgi:peptidoglycan/LPS O-acetylase OafA/YrhL